MKIRTRIAPSPTGFPHIGTIYQVLFDFSFAKKLNGEFILRIEDTDRARYVEGAEEVIYESLSWFGLNPDESPIKPGNLGPYRQSERLEIYRKHVDELINKKYAYYCFCSKERLENMRAIQIEKKIPPMYDRLCRALGEDEINKNLASKMSYVVRMKIPDNRKIKFKDLIIGDVEFESKAIDDQVILKSDGFPTYHLGVVVDDHLMNISHVFRGREWISSTPKHVLLYEYFGWEMPKHAHLPLILNTDGKGKLSKRHGHASVDYYKTGGFLPEAVLNYLSNIVWNHPEGKEIYDLNEFIKLFEMTQITSQGARFDIQKLIWVNQQYIQNLSQVELAEKIINFYPNLFQKLSQEDVHILLEKLYPLIRDRMQTLADFEILAGHLFSPFQKLVRNEKDNEIRIELFEELSKISYWQKENILTVLKFVLQKYGIRMPVLYYIFTGKEKGLPLPESLEILGKDKTLERVSI